MARARVIYLIMTDDGEFFTFTVKHEMVSWLKKPREKPYYIDFIARMDDGPEGHKSYIEYEDLFPEESRGL